MCISMREREGRASAHFIRYIAQHVTFMMRHQTILHRKWWGAHARCCCCRFSRLYTTRRSRAKRGLYSTPFAWTICIEIGEFFHFKRETYTHRRGYRKPANEPPALNIHNITTLYYYDDYYTSCIMYNCQNVPFHFFRKIFNDKEKIRDLDPKCNLTIFSAPCSSYDITHTRHLCAYYSVQRLSLVYLGGTKTRSLGGRKIFFPQMFAQMLTASALPEDSRGTCCCLPLPSLTRLLCFLRRGTWLELQLHR